MTLDLIDKIDKIKNKGFGTRSEQLISHAIGSELIKLGQHAQYKKILSSSVGENLKTIASELFEHVEHGFYAENQWQRPFFRAVNWHTEQGLYYEGVLESLRNRALMSQSDIYFLPALDLGMARTQNRNLARDLALELGYHYVFCPQHLSFNGENNNLGFEGNAILTRLPIKNYKIIPLSGCVMTDKVTKRFTQWQALVITVQAGDESLDLVCCDMPKYSSPEQRFKYLLPLLKYYESQPTRSALLGGHFATSCYNTQSSIKFALSLLNKILRDPQYIAREHHPAPQKSFEEKFFSALHHYGFSYENLNEMDEATLTAPFKYYRPTTRSSTQISQYIQRTSLGILEKFFKKSIKLKTDWFMGRQIRASLSPKSERPKVLTHLFYQGRAVSSHHPLLLDFEIASQGESIIV